MVYFQVLLLVEESPAQQHFPRVGTPNWDQRMRCKWKACPRLAKTRLLLTWDDWCGLLGEMIMMEVSGNIIKSEILFAFYIFCKIPRNKKISFVKNAVITM